MGRRLRALVELAVAMLGIHVVAFPADSGGELRMMGQQIFVTNDREVLSRVLDHRALDAIGRFTPVSPLAPKEKESFDRLIAGSIAHVRLRVEIARDDSVPGPPLRGGTTSL